MTETPAQEYLRYRRMAQQSTSSIDVEAFEDTADQVAFDEEVDGRGETFWNEVDAIQEANR